MATDFLASGTHPASLVLHGGYVEFRELRYMLMTIGSCYLTPEQLDIRDHIVAEIDDISHFLENINAR